MVSELSNTAYVLLTDDIAFQVTRYFARKTFLWYREDATNAIVGTTDWSEASDSSVAQSGKLLSKALVRILRQLRKNDRFFKIGLSRTVTA